MATKILNYCISLIQKQANVLINFQGQIAGYLNIFLQNIHLEPWSLFPYDLSQLFCDSGGQRDGNLNQRCVFDLQQQIDMSKPARPNGICASKSLLIDHKNRINNLSSKKPNLKPTSRAASRPPANPTKSTGLLPRVPSPRTTTLPIAAKQQYSKSEEETKVCEWDSGEDIGEVARGWSEQVGQYRQEIMGYISQRECEYAVDGSYLRHSKFLSGKMRVYLVRHIFKMYNKFALMRTTLHLAVLYLDLYFSRQPLLRDQLEGVAAAQACLFIAMKFEQIYPPDLGDWVDRRHRQDVLKFQAAILKALDYQLGHYTVEHHLRLRLWQEGHTEGEGVQTRQSRWQQQMQLLSDLSLFDLSVRQLRPSEVAVAIMGAVRRESGGDAKIMLAVKWMIERNPESLHWLCEQKYTGLSISFL